jgi:hypothetical protein
LGNSAPVPDASVTEVAEFEIGAANVVLALFAN